VGRLIAGDIGLGGQWNDTKTFVKIIIILNCYLTLNFYSKYICLINIHLILSCVPFKF